MSSPLLAGCDLRKSYGSVTALDGVSLDLNPGDSVAIVGASGSGKSTLLRCLAWLEQPGSGQVRFEGTPVMELDATRRRTFRRRVQLMLQDAAHALNPRWRALALVREPLDLLRQDLDAKTRQALARRWMERVALPDWVADRLPGELSGGQRQRVLLARAMVLDPSALLLDEPFAGLDPPAQGELLSLLRDLRAGRQLATAFVTHDPGVAAAVADRIAVFSHGRIVEHGTAARLLAHPVHPSTRLLVTCYKARLFDGGLS